MLVSPEVHGVQALHHQHFGVVIEFVQPDKTHHETVHRVGKFHFFGLRADVRARVAGEQLARFRFGQGDDGVVVA